MHRRVKPIIPHYPRDIYVHVRLRPLCLERHKLTQYDTSDTYLGMIPLNYEITFLQNYGHNDELEVGPKYLQMPVDL